MARSKVMQEAAKKAATSTAAVIPGSQIGDNSNPAREANLDRMESFGAQYKLGLQAKIDAQVFFAGLVRDKAETVSAADDYAKRWLKGSGEESTAETIRTVASKFKGFADANVLKVLKADYKAVMTFCDGKSKADLNDKSRGTVAESVNAEIRRRLAADEKAAIKVDDDFIKAAINYKKPVKRDKKTLDKAREKAISSVVDKAKDLAKRYKSLPAEFKAAIDALILAAAKA